MKKILICPPTYYDIEYEINPWMHLANKVNKERVREAYHNLKELYQSFPVETYEIAPDPELPDMVYTANFGQVYKGVFIPANFKFPQRRKESLLSAEYFKQQFGYDVYVLPEQIFFEGQGDLLHNDEYYFMGWGKRSDREAKDYLAKVLDKPIIDLELVDPYYYHLDTCFAPLTSELAVINPTSFTPEGLEKIHHLFKTIITPSKEDHQLLACNLISVENKIVVAKGVSQQFKENLAHEGYLIEEIDTAEYRKGGGSIKCLSFEF